MFTCTDLTAAQAAFDSKTPRTVQEVIADRYGAEVTMDRHDRAHAPYDGWVDPETGAVYRGGEYLPMPEDEDSVEAGRGYVARKPIFAKLPDGTVTHWNGGTRAQRKALCEVLIAQGNAVLAATSQHVGTVGEKLTATLHIRGLKKIAGDYGISWFHFMLDEAGNVVIYKGTKQLAEKGEAVEVVAKVKSHSEREGVAQTWIERPALKADVDAKEAEKARKAAFAKTPEGKAAKAAEKARRADLLEYQRDPRAYVLRKQEENRRQREEDAAFIETVTSPLGLEWVGKGGLQT